MGIIRTDSVDGDDVLSAVEYYLEEGVPLEEISLRMISEALGRDISFVAIAKHFRVIKTRLACGAAISGEFTDTDMDALRSLVVSILDRRTSLERTEQGSVAQAVADVRRQFEDDLAMKDEIINELEHQVSFMDEKNGAMMLIDDAKNFQLAQYEGRVESLLGTIALLTLVMPALADGLPVAQNLPLEHLSVLQTLRVARIGPQLTAERAAEAYAATGYPFEGI